MFSLNQIKFCCFCLSFLLNNLNELVYAMPRRDLNCPSMLVKTKINPNLLRRGTTQPRSYEAPKQTVGVIEDEPDTTKINCHKFTFLFDSLKHHLKIQYDSEFNHFEARITDKNGKKLSLLTILEDAVLKSKNNKEQNDKESEELETWINLFNMDENIHTTFDSIGSAIHPIQTQEKIAAMVGGPILLSKNDSIQLSKAYCKHYFENLTRLEKKAKKGEFFPTKSIEYIMEIQFVGSFQSMNINRFHVTSFLNFDNSIAMFNWIKKLIPNERTGFSSL